MKIPDKGQPEYGKQYALTGGTKDKCIMNGNTWAESEVCNACGAPMVDGMCDAPLSVAD